MRTSWIPLVGAATLAASACRPGPGGDESGNPGTAPVDRDPVPPQGNLLIEEVYYAGAVPTEGIDRYYADQFIELVNISESPVMLGGLIIGDAPGSSGVINDGDEPGQGPSGNYLQDPDYVYLMSAWRIPGDPEDVLLAPGDSVVIAHDAQDHGPYSALDLSGADYETYVELHGEDLDSPVAENLEPLWYNGGFDWLVTVFGPSILVVSIDAADLEETGSSRGPVEAPVSAVVDTMEALKDADSVDWKRLHPSVDAGFVHVSGTYTGESVRRKRNADGVFQDTDDSGADFEVRAVPEPWGSEDS